MAVQAFNFAFPSAAPFDVVTPTPKFAPVAGVFGTAGLDADADIPGGASQAVASIGLACNKQSGGIGQGTVGWGSRPTIGLNNAGHNQQEGKVLMFGEDYSDFADPTVVGLDDLACAISFDSAFGGWDAGALLIGGRTVQAEFGALTLPA